MKIGIPKEIFEGERRVALVPDMAKRLVGGGHTVRVEQGAGVLAGFPDASDRRRLILARTRRKLTAVGARPTDCVTAC